LGNPRAKGARRSGSWSTGIEETDRIDIIQANDRIALERIVKGIESLENKNAQREAAGSVKEKLCTANLWNKHALRFNIGIFLSEKNGGD
jgi:hypothetical protein